MMAAHGRDRQRRRLVVIAVLATAALSSAVVAIAGRPDSGDRGGACDTPRVAAPSAVAAEAKRTDRSQDGAVAAAVEYATLLSRLLPADLPKARRMVVEIASDNYRAALVAAVDAELPPLQRQLAGLPGSTVHRQSVLATKVDSYTGERDGAGTARVSVWVMLTLGQSTTAGSSEQAGQRGNPVASFDTIVIDLVWEREAWRLDGTSQRPGPTPLLEGEPLSTDQFVAGLDGFADWRPA
jgi:hypothetical protein